MQDGQTPPPVCASQSITQAKPACKEAPWRGGEGGCVCVSAKQQFDSLYTSVGDVLVPTDGMFHATSCAVETMRSGQAR